MSEAKSKCTKNKPLALRLIQRIAHSWHHQTSNTKHPAYVDYWNGDGHFKPSLHFHWNWLGKAHWFCLFLPEWPSLNIFRTFQNTVR